MVLPSLNFNNKNHTWKWMAKEDFSAILFGWRTWPWCFGSAVQFVQRALGPSARLGVPKMGALPSTNWQAYHTIHRFYCRNLYYYIYIYIYIYIYTQFIERKYMYNVYAMLYTFVVGMDYTVVFLGEKTRRFFWLCVWEAMLFDLKDMWVETCFCI